MKKNYEIFITMSHLFVAFLPSAGCLWCVRASPGMIHRLVLQSHGTAKIHCCVVTSLAKAVLLFMLHCSKTYENTLSGGAIFTHFKVSLS